jgi:hypothetical protein
MIALFKEHGITREEGARAVAKYDDLKIQAMLFDMDIDIETWSLVEKRKDTTPIWVKRWREKQAESDWAVIDNGF